MRSLPVEVATVRTPGGAAEGRDAVIAQARRNHQPDEPTQHVITDPIVELDGDRAKVRANLVVNFAAPAHRDESLPAPPRKYTLGETYHFDAVRTPEGWRLSSVETKPVWISPLSAAFLAAALRGAGSADRSPQPG
jgi:SnoaL-like domain